jgi:hypothetical protein
MVSFIANPTRSVAAPDGSEWHVAIIRGNKWPGGWDNAPAFGRHPFERSSSQVIAEGLVEDFLRWLIYKARRRRDWRVVVRRTPGTALGLAVFDESYASKELAAERAVEVVRAIRTSGSPTPPPT